MFKSNVPHPRGTLVPQPPHAPAALPPGFRTSGLGKERFEVPGLFRVLLVGASEERQPFCVGHFVPTPIRHFPNFVSDWDWGWGWG